MAGVEIMATQFANLLEGRFVTPLPPVLILAGFGLVIGLLLTQLVGFLGIAVSIVLCSGFAYFASWCFNRSGLWLPVAVPLLTQLPSAWFMSLYWSRLDQLKEAKQLKEKIEEITAENNRLINQFVDRLQNNETPDLVTEHAAREVFGLCLATDIKGYTSLAESNPSDRLFELLREYFKLLSAAVSSQGGIIANITGDSMLAIWIDLPVAQQQLAACSATLEMGQAIEQFNKLSNLGAFPTRIGLHQGDFTLGSFVMGIPDTTNPVGDIVNTASRIEGVNKQLGTQILASSAITTELNGIFYRTVGCFRFVGKHEPIELIEIVGMQSEVNTTNKTLYKHFAKGLIAFRQGQWQAAKVIFQTLHDKYEYDGPTQFYLAKSSAYQDNPPQDWDGCINLATK
jgi:adenylate cyclase